MGYSLRGHKELDMAERLTQHNALRSFRFCCIERVGVSIQKKLGFIVQGDTSIVFKNTKVI